MSRREQQKEARRQRIFAVALELFEARGFDAVTVEEIATGADIAKGTFFNYFPTKEAVLLHLNDMQIARLHAIAAQEGFGDLSFAEQIRRIFSGLAEGVTGRSDIVRILIGQTLLNRTALGTTATAIRSAFERTLEKLALAAQARGEVHSAQTAEEAARLLVGIYFLTLIDWLDQAERDLSGMLTRNLELTLRGIGSHG